MNQERPHRLGLPLPAALALAVLSGCTEFPEVDAAVDPAVYALPYPVIVPLAPLLSAAETDATTPTDLEDRAAALRARADALRAAP